MMSQREGAPPATNLKTRAQLFKALGHPTRLLILNLVKTEPRHGEELAAILRMPAASLSHHLAKLTNAGLLKTKREQYCQIYSLSKGVLDDSLCKVVFAPLSAAEDSVAEDAFQQKVLRTFFQHGRLVSVPAQLKKRRIVMQKLVEEFEPERDYAEREVNRILVDFHDDVAYLRRELVSQGLMAREKGTYRRCVVR